MGAPLIGAGICRGAPPSDDERGALVTPRRRRLALVLGVVVGVAIAGGLTLRALRANVMFFFDPSQVAAGEAPRGERFRLGGMVTKGSVRRAPGSLEINFVVTDFRHNLPVRYTGVLPDLFREGQGVVAHGRIGAEKYMPPEVARALKKEAATAAAAAHAGS
jgi:cytochrome c-type biogenesis protein CcmE